VSFATILSIIRNGLPWPDRLQFNVRRLADVGIFVGRKAENNQRWREGDQGVVTLRYPTVPCPGLPLCPSGGRVRTMGHAEHGSAHGTILVVQMCTAVELD